MSPEATAWFEGVLERIRTQNERAGRDWVDFIHDYVHEEDL